MHKYVKRLIALALLILTEGCFVVESDINEAVDHALFPTRAQDEVRNALDDLYRTSATAKLLGERSEAVLVFANLGNNGYLVKGGDIAGRYRRIDGPDRGRRPASQAIFFTTLDALKEFTASSEFLFSADRAFEVVDVHTIKDAKLDMPIIVVLWWNPAAWASTLDPSPLAYRIRGDINPEGLAASIKIDGQTIAH